MSGNSAQAPIQVPPPVPPEFGLLAAFGNKSANDACKERLEQLQLNPGPKIYPKTMDPGAHGTEVKIQTNIFGLEVFKNSDVFQYSVSIKADLTPTKEAVFTKKGKEDYVVLDRHQKCVAILFHAMETHQDFFQTQDNCYVYDGQSLLFSTIDIFRQEGAAKTKVFEIDGSAIDHEDLQKLACIKLEVFPTKNARVKFTQDDIGRRTSDSNIEAVHGAYHQILELAFNQSSLRDSARCVVFEHGKIFFITPANEGYSQEDYIDVGDGKKLIPGIKKTVQFIEGHQGRGANNPSVIIDGMKVAFHKEQTVHEKLEEIMSNRIASGLKDFDRERCAAVIKGLDCYTKYTDRVRHLRIEGIHHECAENSRFQLKNEETSTVAAYYRERYQMVLKYPKANLIVCKDKGNLNFYPMEVLTISPNQRVKISQQTSAQSQKTTKESAVLPDVRQRLIVIGKTAADIRSENEVLRRLGVLVSDEPLLVSARQFPPVKLAVQPTGPMLSMRDNKWRISQYARPATAPNIWALYCVGSQTTRFSHDMLKKFGEEFVGMFRTKGVILSPPADIGLVLFSEIMGKLDDAAKSNCSYVLIITDDSITNLHQKYKMVESSTGMIVQDMKISKALSVLQGKKLTLENVVNKTNVKLGGINYIFTDTKKFMNDHLIIGIGVSHPPAGTKYLLEGKGVLNPTIIGYSYNANKSQEFSGDFVLGPAGQDTIAVIEDIVTKALLGYQKWHDGNNPKRVLVYRSGTGEGSHGNVIAYEVPLARFAINQFSPNIKLVYINVSKDHTCRLFRKDLHEIAPRGNGSTSGSRNVPPPPKSCDLNIGPGICVDSQVTHPGCKQFYLNSHITLQGTAKTPLYSVLADDVNVSMAGLEEITYNLCHLHQIVGLPTSLPTPLYVANEYAKRGRDLWNEHCEKNPVIRQTGSERERLQEISEAINYQTKHGLIDRRLNA
ncbi:hypothetical protein CAEBREN_25519 [Caenorhabditis brenneri]|uniref:Piwi domain-containing protein n=1 Tax=Caenorhabditis brenneri TaxID=135651 RepID=G0PF46_CAEBE|nr:hypothetical protein CAEBREN_25519 [Caenorhabditis brenneri]